MVAALAVAAALAACGATSGADVGGEVSRSPSPSLVTTASPGAENPFTPDPNNLTYHQRDMAKVEAAGYREHVATVNGVRLNYAEGPDNGPALLLIHGQTTDWSSYAPVLPALATSYHVFAVDCPGHGRSAHDPKLYSAVAMGRAFVAFIDQVVRTPAVVSGHSSGGLVATWMAANARAQVRGVVLEDPPLFTTVPPRSVRTWNYVTLAVTCHAFLASGEKDFVSYYLRHSASMAVFQGVQKQVTEYALTFLRDHPGQPLMFPFFPPAMNEAYRSLGQYDPRFGDAFYTDSFDAGFDHAGALSRIAVPAVLIHTNWSYVAGILRGAMDGHDAERARSLIKDVTFVKVDSGHGFHVEKPDDFVAIMTNFRARWG